MAEKKQIITATSEEEFTQKLKLVWSDVSQQAAQRAVATIIRTELRTERFEKNIKRLNLVLLTVATVLVLMFPVECLMIVQLQELASAYAVSVGL